MSLGRSSLAALLALAACSQISAQTMAQTDRQTDRLAATLQLVFGPLGLLEGELQLSCRTLSTQLSLSLSLRLITARPASSTEEAKRRRPTSAERAQKWQSVRPKLAQNTKTANEMIIIRASKLAEQSVHCCKHIQTPQKQGLKGSQMGAKMDRIK